MIAKTKAMHRKAAEKQRGIRKAVEGSSSLGNDAASAAEYKPPIESLPLPPPAAPPPPPLTSPRFCPPASTPLRLSEAFRGSQGLSKTF